ncbi:MAG: flagellar protein FliS [Ignavibacteriaceae bacterium]
MYNSTFARNSGRVNQYLIKELMEATPQQLIIRIYDVAVVSCQKKEFIRTNNAIQILINALRFEGEEVKEVSTGLLRLYLFCQDQTRKGNFEIAQKILSELRETWLKVL